jgi:hypothetical protein
MAVVNVPKNIAVGLKIASIAGRRDLFFAFSALYAFDNLFIKYGKLKAAINSRG